MPRTTEYTNLSIDKKKGEYLKRAFEKYSQSGLSWSAYCSSVVESAITREKFLREAFPHIDIVKVMDNEIILMDNEKNEPVKVFKHGKKFETTAKTNKEDYILYACIHPELLF